MSDQLDPRTHAWVRSALACGDLGVLAIDVATRVATLDDRSAEMLGLSAGEVAVDEYLRAVEPADRQRVAEHLEEALAGDGDAYHDEFRTVSKRWVTVDGRTQRDASDRRVTLVGLLCDTTLRRTTEDARSRLVDEMARSLRFTDMLVGVAAHDLRGPLAGIAAAADTVARTARDPAVESAMARIAGNVEGMARIIGQLLDVTHARLDGQIPLRTEEIDLAAIARQVVGEIQARHPDATIRVEARADTRCTADPDRMAQVIANLVGNAVRHGADARAVRVVIDGTGGKTVSIRVTNPGTIPPELTPTLFNPFRRLRTDQSRADGSHGLGLGLYIARRIALGHGGDITVTSSAEDGTTFLLQLPRVATSGAFSLTPERAEEEDVAIQRLGAAEQHSRVTASMFGVLPVQQRAPEAFASLVDRHARLLELALQRQIYRDARTSLTSELRALAEQLGGMGASAHDVGDLHSHALQKAIKGAPAVKVQALVSEGRLVALELMGRLVTFYRKRSGFGSLARPGNDKPS